DVRLIDTPRSVGSIGFAWSEPLDSLFDLVVPGYVRDQVLQAWEGVHRLHCDGLCQIQVIQARHAHQTGTTIDFSRARSALARLAIPADREIGRPRRLDAMYDIENDHARFDFGLVVFEVAAGSVTAPDSKRGFGSCLRRHLLLLLDDLLQLFGHFLYHDL